MFEFRISAEGNMKAIVQRVLQSSVTVGEEVVSSIGKGLCILVGVSRHDSRKDIDYMVRKILNLRVFEDDQGKRWAKSVKDLQLEVLCVSQFTLMCTLKGNKPDYHEAMGPELSQQFYEEFLGQMREAYSADKVKDGKFGAYMQVHIQNDGPVTIPLESPPTLTDDKKDRKGAQTKPSKQAAPPGDTQGGDAAKIE